jgi:hypothetical protein
MNHRLLVLSSLAVDASSIHAHPLMILAQEHIAVIIPELPSSFPNAYRAPLSQHVRVLSFLWTDGLHKRSCLESQVFTITRTGPHPVKSAPPISVEKDDIPRWQRWRYQIMFPLSNSKLATSQRWFLKVIGVGFQLDRYLCADFSASTRVGQRTTDSAPVQWERTWLL